MTSLPEIDALNRRLDKALSQLKAERRDVKGEYDASVRKLEKAKQSLLDGADEPELFDVAATLDDELTALLENPSLK